MDRHDCRYGEQDNRGDPFGEEMGGSSPIQTPLVQLPSDPRPSTAISQHRLVFVDGPALPN